MRKLNWLNFVIVMVILFFCKSICIYIYFIINNVLVFVILFYFRFSNTSLIYILKSFKNLNICDEV